MAYNRSSSGLCISGKGVRSGHKQHVMIDESEPEQPRLPRDFFFVCVGVNPNPINSSILAQLVAYRRFVNHATQKATESRLFLFKSQS